MSRAAERQLLLVVGAPRSGTTWLHHMLAVHPEVACIQEELTVFTYLAMWERLYQAEKSHSDLGHWRQGTPLLFNEDEFHQGLRTLADTAYARLAQGNPGATHILDKHPNYALHLPLIIQLYPNAKVIHMVRDGREVVVSMMSAKRRIGFGKGEIHGAARHWAGNLLAAREAGAVLGPERYREVRYEELKADAAKGMKDIFNFCQLPATEAMLQRIAVEYDIRNKQVSRGDPGFNALRDKPDAIWKAKLSLEERWTLDRMAGHLLRELNYATPGWWAVKPGDKARMALLNVRRKLMNTLGSAKHTWVQPMAVPVQQSVATGIPSPSAETGTNTRNSSKC